MTRVKRGVTAHRRHKKIILAAKGYRGLRSKTFQQAKQAVLKAGMHAYKDRKNKKRTFRRLWILRINAALRTMGFKYSRLIDAMTKKNIQINRKLLSEMAYSNPDLFKKVIEEIMQEEK